MTVYNLPRTGPLRIDALHGMRPTWRMGDDPIYREMVAEYGIPGDLTGPAGQVIPGELVEAS